MWLQLVALATIGQASVLFVPTPFFTPSNRQSDVRDAIVLEFLAKQPALKLAQPASLRPKPIPCAKQGSWSCCQETVAGLFFWPTSSGHNRAHMIKTLRATQNKVVVIAVKESMLPPMKVA